MIKRIREALLNPDSKRKLNRELFDQIARRYQLATRLLSFGRDSAWKKQLVEALPGDDPRVCLDLASGTGDIARLLGDRYPGAEEIVCFDLSSEMLKLARERLSDPRYSFVLGDIGAMPFDGGFADVITGGYALRNVPDLERSLTEINRVLKPGGVAFFLDFVQPPEGFRRGLHHFLLHVWGAIVGLILHGRPSVYRYIPESLKTYPDSESLKRMLEGSGFVIRRQHRHFFGIMERIELEKASSGNMIS